MAASIKRHGFVEILDQESDYASDSGSVQPSDSEQEENDQNGYPEVGGNSAWADAMAKVLASKPPKNKQTVLLSRAKKDDSVQLKPKNANNELEVVNEEGQNLNEHEIKSSQKRTLDAKEWHERKKQKHLWEMMGRKKPDVLEKERERQLAIIATKGVVQLFNAVQQHQKRVEQKLTTTKNSEAKREKVMKSVTKGEFLDLLKGYTSEKVQPREAPIKQENPSEKWSVLRDDFLMGATLKDWDKNVESEDT